MSVYGTVRSDRHCVDDAIGCPAAPNDGLRAATRRSHAAIPRNSSGASPSKGVVQLTSRSRETARTLTAIAVAPERYQSASTTRRSERESELDFIGESCTTHLHRVDAYRATLRRSAGAGWAFAPSSTHECSSRSQSWAFGGLLTRNHANLARNSIHSSSERRPSIRRFVLPLLASMRRERASVQQPHGRTLCSWPASRICRWPRNPHRAQ